MRLLALALLLCPLAAQAELAACNEDKALFDTTLQEELPISSPEPPVWEEGWCVLRNLQADDPAETFRIRIETLRWKRVGLAPRPSNWPSSGTLELHAEGIRMHATSGPPLLDYGLRIQSQPYPSRVTLIAAYDAESRAITITRAEIDLPYENGITLRDTRFTHGPGFTAPLVALTTLRLHALSLDIESHGFFETNALLPLLTALGDMEEDPEPQVNALREEARAYIASLPQALMAEASRAALGDLLTDLPNPWGRVALRIEAPNGFGAANLAPLGLNPGPEALNTVLSSLRLTVDYTRSPR